MTSASGRVLLAEDYFRNVSNTYDHEGSLVSSYSAAEGLMRTRTGADGELVMEWYAPAAVTVLADGTYEVTGEPYKTSSYLSSEENGVPDHRHHAPAARTAGPHHHPYGRTRQSQHRQRPGGRHHHPHH